MINENTTERSNISGLRVFTKAIERTAQYGPAAAFRRGIWKLSYNRFQNRLSKPGHEVPAVIRFQGHEFELHGSKNGVSEELFLYGVHEPCATENYLRLLSPGDQVLDIGANLGYYLLLASKCVGRTGRVIGFEPAPSVYEVLQRNIKHSGQDNIRAYQCALGNSTGMATFYESEIPNWGSFFADATLRQTRAIEVETNTVDQIVRGMPDFRPNVLRMDIEGAELLVLEGASDTLQKYRPMLFIEFHNSALGWDSVRNTLLRLKGLGYASGVLIERTWDQPWIAKWMRNRRRWKGGIEELIARVEDSNDPLLQSTLIFIMRPSAK